MAKSNSSTTFDNDAATADFGSGSSSGLRGRASGLGQTASQQIDNSPLVAVGAGLALGAVLGAVLPASRKEKELLTPLGSKLTDAGFGAVDRAKDMGKQKFDEMAGDKVREFLGMTSSSGSSSGSGNGGGNA
jgi:hypothetical protein